MHVISKPDRAMVNCGLTLCIEEKVFVCVFCFVRAGFEVFYTSHGGVI